MLSFHEILVQIAERVDDPKQPLDEQEKAGLERIVVRCKTSLTDIDTVLDKYSVRNGQSRAWARTRFAAADLTPLRLRIAAQVDRLNAYNDTLILSSQMRMERNLGKIIRALRRQGSTISVDSVTSRLHTGCGWSDLGRVLEGEGISPQMISDRLDEVKRLLSPIPVQRDREQDDDRESDGSKYAQSCGVQVRASRTGAQSVIRIQFRPRQSRRVESQISSETSQTVPQKISTRSERPDSATPVSTESQEFARVQIDSNGGETENGAPEIDKPKDLHPNSPIFPPVHNTPCVAERTTERVWRQWRSFRIRFWYAGEECGFLGEMESELWKVFQSCHWYGGFDKKVVQSLDQALGHLVTLGIYHDIMGTLGQYHIGWQLALNEKIDEVVLAHLSSTKERFYVARQPAAQESLDVGLKVHELRTVILLAIKAIVGKDRIAVVDSLRACLGGPLDCGEEDEHLERWLEEYKTGAYLHWRASIAKANDGASSCSRFFTDGPVQWIDVKQPGSPYGSSPELDLRPKPIA